MTGDNVIRALQYNCTGILSKVSSSSTPPPPPEKKEGVGGNKDKEVVQSTKPAVFGHKQPKIYLKTKVEEPFLPGSSKGWGKVKTRHSNSWRSWRRVTNDLVHLGSRQGRKRRKKQPQIYCKQFRFYVIYHANSFMLEQGWGGV